MIDFVLVLLHACWLPAFAFICFHFCVISLHVPSGPEMYAEEGREKIKETPWKNQRNNQRMTFINSARKKMDHLIHYPFMNHFGEGAHFISYPFTNRYPTFFVVAACLFGVLIVAFVLCQGSFTSDCRSFGSDLGDVGRF